MSWVSSRVLIPKPGPLTLKDTLILNVCMLVFLNSCLLFRFSANSLTLMDFQYHPFLIGFCSNFFCHYGWSALLFTVVFFKLAFNGFGLGEGGAFHHKCLCGALNRHFCQTRVGRSFFFFVKMANRHQCQLLVVC